MRNASPIHHAGQQLRNGAVVAFPTETVYGVGALCSSDAGVQALYALKGRAADVPLQLLVPDFATAAQYVQFHPRAEQLAAACWPGPLTLVLPKRAGAQVSAHMNVVNNTLGVRVADHPVIAALLQSLAAPIAASSANPSGQPAAQTAAEVAAYFSDSIVILVGGAPALGTPSTVVDYCDATTPKILREGGIPNTAIDAIAGL